jgi:mannose-6-phosphate isomerase-like protein (cupin superfamily)
MRVLRFDEAPTFAPRGHEGVLNRALTSRERDGVEQVGVWFGSFDAGAGSDVHVHESSVQVYVVLSGTFVVGDGVEERRLSVHDTAIIPAGERHQIRTEDATGTVMVISAPTLR